MNHLIPAFMAKGFKRFTCDARGGVFVFVGFGIMALITATLLAVEFSNYTKVKSNFRNAVDQALLAAAAKNAGSRDEQLMQETALEYLQANLGTDTGYEVTDFKVSSAGSQQFRWRAEGKGKVDTKIARIIGVNELKVEHVAEAGWDEQVATELVAMVDMSGTMCARFERNGSIIGVVPDRNCTKLKMMQTGLKKIVEAGVGVSRGSGSTLFKVGLVPYTYKVKVPAPTAVPNFLIDSEIAARNANPNDPVMGDPNYFTDVSDAETVMGGTLPLPQVMPMTAIRTEADKQAYLGAVDRLVSNDTANREFLRMAWKRSSLGAHIAGLMLDSRYQAMFGNPADGPAPFGTAKVRKVVIMMTDAANIGCCFTNWPPGNFTSNYLYSYHPDHNHLAGVSNLKGVCQQMKDAGIEIFTVLLDVKEEDMNERGGEIVQAYRDCASSRSHAFQVPFNDNKALEHAYTRIAESLVKLKLTF